VLLGSRLKRLAERMQAGAARVIADAGLPVQPAHMPLLAALQTKPMTVSALVDAVGVSQPAVTRSVGQLVALGLVSSNLGIDRRERILSLTPAGEAVMMRARLLVWPRVGEAVSALCEGLSGPFLEQVSGLEEALAERSLEARCGDVGRAALRIREFDPALAADFRDINAEWISAMFRLEQTDQDVLDHPSRHIIDRGGAILFVEAPGLGIIGTCALQRTGSRSVELTKMGVRSSARGLKAGEFLLAATIERAEAMGADPLYLLTNTKCEAAIHLYEKLGFIHDAGVMEEFGSRYQRCNVAMRYSGGASETERAA